MQKQLFAYQDSKAEVMLDPFVSLNVQTAIRDTEIRLSQDKNMAAYCADFTLMLVGEWDPETGISPLPITAVIELKTFQKSGNDDE